MAIIEGNFIHFREHGETLLYHLHQLYTYNMFLDACLVCNGSEIFAHKSVLAAASPLLRERLFEFGDCHHVRIEIEQELLNMSVNAEDIKLLVEFIYKGQVSVPEPRLSLFLELGNHFQILGLYKQAPSIGGHLSFLSQPLPNYNLNQSSFSTVSNLDPFSYDDLTNIQNDCFTSVFPNSILCPERVSDNIIKPDKSLTGSITNTTFSDLCIGNTTLDNFQLLTDRNIEQNDEELDPKLSYDFENFVNADSYSETFPSSSVPQSDFTEYSQIQSEHSKDIFEDSCPSSPSASDPDNLFNNLSNHPNSFFSPCDLDPVTHSSDPCLNEIAFQPCKIPDGTVLPERQVRLKVKDSIGGVSLQDTSLGERSLKQLQVEAQCNTTLNTSTLPSVTDVSKKQVQVREDLSETVEILAQLQVGNVENGCTHCSEKLASTDSLIEHLWEKHTIGKQFQCLFCSFKTVIESKLAEHGKIHLKAQDQQCCVCGKKFKTRATLRNHLSCHASVKGFNCTKCSAHYSQRNNLLRHMASEHRVDMGGSPLKEQLKCSDCSFQTWAPHKLNDHKVRCHTQDKPYKCSSCSYSSTEKNSLAKHLRTHTQERPYICDSCGISFITVSSLKRHCRSHTKEKPYICKECGQQYADKKRLRDHYLKHKSVKPFKCSYCEYHCRRKDNLQSHIKRTHSEDEKHSSIDIVKLPSNNVNQDVHKSASDTCIYLNEPALIALV